MLSLLIAHPDDESWAFAGLLQAASRLGWPLRILCLTSGEAGVDRRASAGGASSFERAALPHAREQELRHALIAGGIDADLTFARLPDGALDAHANKAQSVLDAWWDERTTVGATWGPAGGYGHRDHVMCYELCAALLRTHYAPPMISKAEDKKVLREPPPLLLAHFPWDAARAVHEQLLRYRRGALVMSDFEGARARERARISCAVEPGHKRAMLSAHRSQVGAQDVAQFVHTELTRALLTREVFDVMHDASVDSTPLRALFPDDFLP